MLVELIVGLITLVVYTAIALVSSRDDAKQSITDLKEVLKQAKDNK